MFFADLPKESRAKRMDRAMLPPTPICYNDLKKRGSLT